MRENSEVKKMGTNYITLKEQRGDSIEVFWRDFHIRRNEGMGSKSDFDATAWKELGCLVMMFSRKKVEIHADE